MYLWNVTFISVLCITLYVEDRPDLKRLQEIMRIEDIDIITQWRDLGLELVDSNNILKVIETNHPSDANTCCRVMFEKWLEMKPDASWSQLVTALHNIRMNTAADAINKLFQSGIYYVCVHGCVCHAGMCVCVCKDRKAAAGHVQYFV